MFQEISVTTKKKRNGEENPISKARSSLSTQNILKTPHIKIRSMTYEMVNLQLGIHLFQNKLPAAHLFHIRFEIVLHLLR